MTIYLRIVQMEAGVHSEVWDISNVEAVRLGVTNAKDGPGCYFVAAPGEYIFDAIKRQASAWFDSSGENPFHPVTLGPGEYYPWIARPNDQHPYESPGANPAAFLSFNPIAESIGQLEALTRQLREICQTIHPVDSNLNAFGHDIRNLLILAATEVETLWRGVLVANGVTKDRLSTKEYIQLRDAMRLGEYEVRLSPYPWLQPMTPFRDWNTQSPTQSLGWYDAYNAVKHNRGGEFARATLRQAIDAVSACAIMQVAQFGLYEDTWRWSEVKSFFKFPTVPAWPPADVYLYPYAEIHGSWIPKNFPFAIE